MISGLGPRELSPCIRGVHRVKEMKWVGPKGPNLIYSKKGLETLVPNPSRFTSLPQSLTNLPFRASSISHHPLWPCLLASNIVIIINIKVNNLFLTEPIIKLKKTMMFQRRL